MVLTLSNVCSRIDLAAKFGKLLPKVLGDFGFGSIASKRKIAPLSFTQCTNTNPRRRYSDHNRGAPPTCLRDDLICNVVDPVVDSLDKVTIVGAGMVGIACANAILFQRISSHVALIDAFPKKLRGEGLEFNHGLAFLDNPRVEYDTDFCISSNSKVVIITTGARQSKNESKLDLLQRNADIIKCIIFPLIEYSPKAVFLVVTNPVDIMSWLTWKISGLPVNRVIGTGTHLDSARFRCLIAERIGIAASSVHGYIIGEHGDNQVPLWSGVNIAGVQFRDVLPNIGMTTDEEKWYEVTEEVVQIGDTIRCLKGYSNTTIGLAVADIVKDILRNAQTVKAVSTLVQGHHEIPNEMFLSLPCSIGENGISNVIRMRITELEKKMLLTSADEVFKVQKTIKL